jgi:type II secretory pathway component PulJ
MFGELSQSSVMEVLLFLAIVSLTLVSTFDIFMQAVKQKKNIDKKY